jgi:CRISP-associated protein Cas1
MTSQHPDPDSAPFPSTEETPRPKHLPLISSHRAQVVPARMLNEVMYCERLMYLEWVHGEFADNYFTVDGRNVHERADSPGGALPAPARSDMELASDSDDEDDADVLPRSEALEQFHARSVWLTSEALGITAKIDVVEGGADGSVIPIEYKRGSIPNIPERAYVPERVQLCAQVLLLREHGFHCSHGEIYFAKSKRRVSITISDELIRHTHWAVKLAQEVAKRSDPPEPLQDSVKCRNCSLVSICLPDEVNHLRRFDGGSIEDPPEPLDELTGPLDPDPWGLASPETSGPQVRRLYAARDDRVPVYVQEHGAQVGVSGERLSVRTESGTTHVRLMNTAHIVLRGNVQLTTQAAAALLDRGVPVVFLTSGGYFRGRLSGADTNNVELRIAQYRTSVDPSACLKLARSFIGAKIRNARTMLRRNHQALDAVVLGQLKQLRRKVTDCDNVDTLLGLEGSAARVYFQNFTGMFGARGMGKFDFERRNRRPPTDPVNALLSFAYALLTKDVVIAATAAGLDPLLGFYHRPRFGRPGLALDLMEEFRPIIADSVVLSSISNQIVTPSDFTMLAKACSIKEHARKRFIETYERRMDQTVTHPVFGYTVSYRRVLEVQARLLSRVLMGEVQHYPAFQTR